MKIQFAHIPRQVKIAAAMLALMIFWNLPDIYLSIRYRFSIGAIVGITVYFGASLAIAYWLLRGSEIVRMLWSLWAVGGFLIFLARILVGFYAFRNLVSCSAIVSFYQLATVGLLYSPASRDFFGESQRRAGGQPKVPAGALDKPTVIIASPICRKPYSVEDRLTEPTICPECSKLGSTIAEVHTPFVEPHRPVTAKFLAYASMTCYLCALLWIALAFLILGKFGIAAISIIGPILAIAYIPAGLVTLGGFVLAIKSFLREDRGKEAYAALVIPFVVFLLVVS
jgi:hypothetical protein